jgi:hypothetical protein
MKLSFATLSSFLALASLAAAGEDAIDSGAVDAKYKFQFTLRKEDWCLDFAVKDYTLTPSTVTINNTHVCPEKGHWKFNSTITGWTLPGFTADIQQKADQWESGFNATYTTNTSTSASFEIWGTWGDKGVTAHGSFN